MRVLLLEDELLIAKMIEAIVSSIAPEDSVTTITSPREMPQDLSLYDVIVLDCHQDDICTISHTLPLVMAKKGRLVKVIVMSGSPSQDIHALVTQYKVEFVHKPFDVAAFQRLILGGI